MTRVLLNLALVSCTDKGPGQGDTGECTGEGAPSVLASVVDPEGAPLRATAVTWHLGSSQPQAAECLDGGCTRWVAGVEVVGDITVQATYDEPVEPEGCRAQDSAALTVAVALDAEGCHVVTEEVTLALDPTRVNCAR